MNTPTTSASVLKPRCAPRRISRQATSAAHVLRRLFEMPTLSPTPLQVCSAVAKSSARADDGLNQASASVDDPLSFAAECWISHEEDASVGLTLSQSDEEDADAAWLDAAIQAAAASAQRRSETPKKTSRSGARTSGVRKPKSPHPATPKPKQASTPKRAGVHFTQPRGRPPHDQHGNKMRWDTTKGVWVSTTSHDSSA